MLRWPFIPLILLLLLGCQASRPAPKPDPVATAGEGVAGIVAHTESAERHVTSAIPHADPIGKVYLTAASDEHKEVLSDAAEVRIALAGAREQAIALAAAVAEQKTAYQKLEGRWFVVWGRRIEQALWIVGITWLLLGVASVVFGMGNPLSWTWRIGKEITRLVPLMNPFSWLRDWLIARRKAV